jgi:hypothetical protein
MMGIAVLRTLALLGAMAVQEPSKTSPGDEFARIDQWIQGWQPTAEDRRMEEIGWAKDIPEAIRLSKLHARPVFVFTHKGRMNLGRQ